MKKRFVSTILCAAMVAGSLTGCGLKSPDEPTTVAQTTAAATEAASEAEGETTAAPADNAGGS